MKRKRQVFVSHTNADAALAHRLGHDLAAVGLGVWIAPESIAPGEGWVDAINRGLAESSDVVVLLTQSAVNSMWVRQEVNTAIALERKGRIRLVPLEVERCDMPPLWSAYQKIALAPDYKVGLRQLREVLTGKRSREAPRKIARIPVGPSGHHGVDKASLAELDTYARLYDALYPRLPGDQRNYVLNAVIVDQLYQLGSATKLPAALVASLFARGGDGDRMVALLLLETAPSAGCLGTALDAIAEPRSPFEQYHGLRAAELMTHLLSASQKRKLTSSLEIARGKYLIPANRSRWEAYVDIKRKLSAPKRAAAGVHSAPRSPRRAKRIASGSN